MTVPAEAEKRFDAQGFVILPHLIDKPTAERWRGLAERAASMPRSPGGSVDVSELGDLRDYPILWEHPDVLALVRRHLGGEIDVDQVVVRAPAPGHGAQTLHTDWMDTAPPDRWWVCNAVFALCDIPPQRGATRLIPGSHRDPDTSFRARDPQDHHPREEAPGLATGDVLVFNGHLLHSGTRNDTDAPRLALLVTYRRHGRPDLPGPGPA